MTQPTEYRLELSDETNRLGLYLSAGLKQMTVLELCKLNERLGQRMQLGPKPPSAKQMSHCLALIGMQYVEAICKAAEQCAKDVTPCG